jgi:hypothetical protein
MTPARRSATVRPTSWWLATLRRRAERMHEEALDLSQPIAWRDAEEHRAAIKFFNAAFRAEESGLRQAHELSRDVASWDVDLAEVLRLYGDEEGWHRQLLTNFLDFLGGSVEPMGKVTRTLYRLYGRARRMETIVLANLMFELIGSTTYRLALRNVHHSAARQMLTILTRDESFHVPLNVHFLRHVLSRTDAASRRRLKRVHKLLFFSLVALPLASRPKARAFDSIPTAELSRAYARELARLFAREPDLELMPPWTLLGLLGISRAEVFAGDGVSAASIEAAERSADRARVNVTAL